MKDLLVIYSDSVTDRLKKGLNNYPRHAKDITTLLQTIVRELLNQIGTNHFDTNIGSILYQFASKGYSPHDEDQVRSAVAMAVSQTEEKILYEQSLEPYLKNEEELVSLELDSILYDHSQGSWLIDIRVKTKADHVYLVKI